MARERRTLVPECAHHVVAKAVDRRKVFYNGFVKGRYLRRLQRLCEEHGIRVHAYALMETHVHLVVTPSDERGISKMIQVLHSWLARRYNRRIGRRGPVFEDRFYCSPMETPHFFTAMRYVELNPRRAGIGEWMKYVATSVRAHAEGRLDRLVKLDDQAMERRFGVEEEKQSKWTEYLSWSGDDGAVLMKQVLRNKPLGSREWVSKLEAKLDRNLTVRPVGRPPGKAVLVGAGQVAAVGGVG